MKKVFNIDKYLEEADTRFSGAGGLDPFSDAAEESGGGLFASADGNDDEYWATGQRMAQPKSPTPYQVIVENTTGGTLTATLFGKNQYLLSTNFGSPAGIVITPAQTNISYLELLQQSADQPFETSLIRIQSSEATQITQILTVTSKDANGQEAVVPIITQSYFSANQFQSGILDVPYTVRIDGNTNISFPVLGETTVTMTFFPSMKWNDARTLVGAKPVQQYGAPAVNLVGVYGMMKPKKVNMVQ